MPDDKITPVSYVTSTELKTLIDSTALLVVDFTAVWCGPCKIIAPMMEQLATEFSDRVTVVKVDIDQHRDCATDHKVKSLPTVLMFKAGTEVERLVGSARYEVFQDALQRNF